MKKKVRKFASGGDILTAAGAVLVGKALYDKYKEGKGKDDEDSDYARKAKEFRDKKNAEAAAVESKAEPKAETKEPSAGEKRAMAASKGRPELIPEDADEATMRSDNYPSRKPVVTTTPKKAAPVAKKTTPAAPAAKKAEPASESSNTTPSTYYTPPVKSVTSTTKTEPPKPATEKKYGIGPYNSFAGLHKVLSPKTESQADRVAAAKKKKEELASSGMKRGGAVKKYASGGSVSSASKRADGIAQRGKTRGRVL